MSDLKRTDELAHIDAASEPTRWLRMLRGMWPGSEAKRQRYRQLFTSLVGQTGARVLEVGCGAGGAVRFFTECVPEVLCAVGVDPSGLAIQDARRAVSNQRPAPDTIPHYLVMDGRSLGFADRTFDVVFCSRVLVHAPEPVCILEEMVRVLKVGGSLLVVEPDRDGTLSSVDLDWVNRLYWSHLRSLNPDIGRRVYPLLHRLGLADIRVESAFNVSTRPPSREQVLEIERALQDRRGEYWALVEAGLCTVEDLERHGASLREAEETGIYLRCDLEFVYRARRPH